MSDAPASARCARTRPRRDRGCGERRPRSRLRRDDAEPQLLGHVRLGLRPRAAVAGGAEGRVARGGPPARRRGGGGGDARHSPARGGGGGGQLRRGAGGGGGRGGGRRRVGGGGEAGQGGGGGGGGGAGGRGRQHA